MLEQEQYEMYEWCKLRMPRIKRFDGAIIIVVNPPEYRYDDRMSVFIVSAKCEDIMTGETFYGVEIDVNAREVSKIKDLWATIELGKRVFTIAEINRVKRKNHPFRNVPKGQLARFTSAEDFALATKCGFPEHGWIDKFIAARIGAQK